MNLILQPHEFDAICSIIDSHWASFKKPIALANVGHQLTAQGIDVKSLLKGRKLGDILRQEFDDKYAVRERPGVLLTWEVYPKGKEEDPSKSAVAAAGKAKPSVPRMPSPMWHAFTKEIAPSKRREVTFPPFRFQDRPTLDTAEESLYIEDQYIVQKGEQAPDQHASEVWASVQRWADSKQLELARLLERPSFSKSESVLDLMIRSLSPEQLQRAQLPLDVVATLRDSNA